MPEIATVPFFLLGASVGPDTNRLIAGIEQPLEFEREAVELRAQRHENVLDDRFRPDEGAPAS